MVSSYLKNMWLKHNNSKCVVPPGELTSNNGTPIIVASLMRSGTHLSIDLLLNNLKQYKRDPLYLNLHPYLCQQMPLDKLLECGSYVCKTHYPQMEYPEWSAEYLEQLAAKAIVLIPERDINYVYRSVVDYDYDGSFDDLLEEKAQFEKFWSRFNPIRINFDQLFDQASVDDLFRQIIDRDPNITKRRKRIMPRSKDMLLLAKWDKLLTRLLGNKAPVANTTIRLGKTKH